MPAPKPDTSPCRTLPNGDGSCIVPGCTHGIDTRPTDAALVRELSAIARIAGFTERADSALALADALDQRAAPVSDSFRGALTKDEWASRVRTARDTYSFADGVPMQRADRACREAFPELAPPND